MVEGLGGVRRLHRIGGGRWLPRHRGRRSRGGVGAFTASRSLPGRDLRGGLAKALSETTDDVISSVELSRSGCLNLAVSDRAVLAQLASTRTLANGLGLLGIVAPADGRRYIVLTISPMWVK